MLGKNCDAKEGGYSDKIIEATMDFLADNYENFKDITPGVALKIADTMDQFPTMYTTILSNQNLYI